MSLDYPFYEELRRRKHGAARWWLVGDRLYYIGLLPAMLAAPGLLFGLGAGLLGFGWHWFVLAAITFPAGVLVFLVGTSFKRRAYALAERDGISPADVYQRGATPQAAEIEPISRVPPQDGASETGKGS